MQKKRGSMKKLFIAALLALLSASPAYADGHGHDRGGGWGWGGWIPPLVIGGVIGYGLAQPQYVYQPAPYPYIYQPAPYQYIYQTAPATQVAPSVVPATSVYYYCEAEKGYYPYVPLCPGGWKKVSATPSQ